MLQIPEPRRPLPSKAASGIAPGEISRSSVRPVDPVQPIEENAALVASLRKSLADKDSALQRTSYAAIRLQKQLEDALRQNEILRKRLKLSPQGPRSGPVVRTAAAGARVGLRQREASARKLALAAAERSRRRRIRFAATAVSSAVLILIWGIWSQLPDAASSKPTQTPLPRRLPAAAQREAPADLPPDSKPVASARARFEASLSRLNRALLYAPVDSPEQVLRIVRQSGPAGTPPVCDFSWNYGQPALLYHAGIPLDVALERCAAAVESYVFPQKKAPAESGQGG